jgi:undecaprenyl-phosphate galactose phosphotransferase
LKRRKYKYVLFAVDWFTVNLAFFLAMALLQGGTLSREQAIGILTGREFLLFVAYSPVVLYILMSNQLYRLHLHILVVEQAVKLLKCSVYSSVGLAIAMFVVGDYWVPAEGRLIVLYFLVLVAVLLVTERVVVMRFLFTQLVKYRLSRRRVLVIGACGQGSRAAAAFNAGDATGLSLVGFLDDACAAGSEVVPGGKVLGAVDDVERVVEEHGVDEILVCIEDVEEERYLDLLDRCASTRARVMVGSEQFGVITKHVYNENYGSMPVFGVFNSSPYMGQPVLKRVGDMMLSLAALIVLSPLLALLAIAVKMDSPGPVLFRQTRIGKNGKPFTFLKFRSMVVGSDNDRDRVKKLKAFIKEEKVEGKEGTKIVDEKKVTRVGRFIRRTSLDELPQLINVIRGEMSLVGPRPCLPYEWENYDEWHKRRLSVTPGCTGVWQVFGRSKVGFRDTVIIDLFYAQNMSFRLDLWLVLKTIPVMLFGDGGK